MRRLLFSTLVLASASHLVADAISDSSEAPMAEIQYNVWQESEIGTTAFFRMENAPFPHASRAEGYTYQETFFPADLHYSDNTVAIYLPTGFDASERVHLLYYFHGWGNNVAQSFEQYQLREMVARSGRNVALVFPQGPRNASDSTLGKLEEENGIRNLTDEVLETLRREEKIGATADLGTVVLSGHSGAYRGMAFSLHRGGLNDHIREVLLLDASYANLDYFVEWMLGGDDRRLLSIFTEHLGGDNAWMMSKLAAAEVPYYLRLDGEHTTAELAQNRLCFVYTTKRDHNQAVDILEEFLRASTLPEISN